MTTHSYNVDDSLSGTGYTNEEIATPDVSYTYDPYYARVATMVDGIGTTTLHLQGSRHERRGPSGDRRRSADATTRSPTPTTSSGG